MKQITTAGAQPQPARALQLANQVRHERSELKARVAGGQLLAGEVILTCPGAVAGMSVLQLLASQRGWGEVRSRAFLLRVAIREQKLIGSLTQRQRLALAAQLAQDSATATLRLAATDEPASGTRTSLPT